MTGCHAIGLPDRSMSSNSLVGACTTIERCQEGQRPTSNPKIQMEGQAPLWAHGCRTAEVGGKFPRHFMHFLTLL